MDGLNSYIRAVLLKDFQKIYSRQHKAPIIVSYQHLAIFTRNRILSKKAVTFNISQEFLKIKLPCLCVCMHTWMVVRFEVFSKEKGRKAHHKLITCLQNSATYQRA